MNHKTILFIISSIAALSCISQAKTPTHKKPLSSVKKISWLNKNIISLLENESSITIQDKNQPPSICFFSADLKFDGTSLKFCELGNGLYGVPLPSYSIINGAKELLYTPYWELFWIYLKQFNLPIFYIGPNTTNGASALKQLGGKLFADADELRAYCAQHYAQTAKPFNATKISDYTAIIAYAGKRDFDVIDKLKADYPNLLFINNFDALFRRQKDKIHEFFNCEELSELRPQWKVYPHVYTPELARQIQADIPSDYYILKPTVGRKALGVVMVEREKLDEVLREILSLRAAPSRPSLKKVESINKASDWQKTAKQTTFIVEAYAPSKTIFYEGRPYDPTLRAAFAVCYDQGKIVSTFFSCFWKKPPYSLNEDVSLTDKHITKSMVGCKTPGQEVEVEDMKKLTKIFNAILPAMYEKILPNLLPLQ